MIGIEIGKQKFQNLLLRRYFVPTPAEGGEGRAEGRGKGEFRLVSMVTNSCEGAFQPILLKELKLTKVQRPVKVSEQRMKL